MGIVLGQLAEIFGTACETIKLQDCLKVWGTCDPIPLAGSVACPHHVDLLCTHKAMPLIERIMPIMVSSSRKSVRPSRDWDGQGRDGVDGRTATNDLLLNPPLAQDGEQERQRVHDGHGQAQLCIIGISLAGVTYLHLVLRSSSPLAITRRKLDPPWPVSETARSGTPLLLHQPRQT